MPILFISHKIMLKIKVNCIYPPQVVKLGNLFMISKTSIHGLVEYICGICTVAPYEVLSLGT